MHGLSCQYENTPRSNRDGSDWTISPNWEEAAGPTLDINQITVDPDIAELLEWFLEEPVFKGIIEAIHGIKSNLGLRERKRAQHWAANYMIEDGKLWYIGGGMPTRAIMRCSGGLFTLDKQSHRRNQQNPAIHTGTPMCPGYW